VISFSIRANRFSGVCLFCNFVRNRISVIEIAILGLVFMARNHNFDYGSYLDNTGDKMECQLIAIKCKYWGEAECPHKEKNILSALLTGKHTFATDKDIEYADKICLSCEKFKSYRF
jgi:hypothetical protein